MDQRLARQGNMSTEDSPLLGRSPSYKASEHDQKRALFALHQLNTDPTAVANAPSTETEAVSDAEGAGAKTRGQKRRDLEQVDSLEDIADDVKPLLPSVRQTVELCDDSTVPVVTFRFFVLATIFVIPGAFIDTVNQFRTTLALYSIFFVQIAAHWAGELMARHLPARTVGRGRFLFSLNPGPWSIKETAIVTIAAKSGATGNLATNALSMVEVYFGTRVPAAAAVGFMAAIVFVGYSYAAIARSMVLYDPQFPWPLALMQSALLRSQAGAGEGGATESDSDRAEGDAPGGDGADRLKNRKGPSTKTHSNVKNHMSVFFVAAAALCAWQMLPEFFFPMTSSIAILCYLAPHNAAANFVGLGLGGMGVLNFSLDWANITSEILLYPYWLQVVQFAGFVLGAWVLIPVAKWSSLVQYKHGLMSNRLFTADGSVYPTEKLMTADGRFNATAYAQYGLVHLGAQRSWNMFFDYGAYVSGVVWVVVFGWDNLRSSFSGRRRFHDRLNALNRAYVDVPSTYYSVMFALSLAVLAAVYCSGYLFVPWWTCVVALVIGLVVVTPLIWLYALSNFQLPIGTFNELLYGWLAQDLPHKHPAGAAFFSCIAGDAWYRAQHHLELMKLGFYNHLPPRLVFFAQVYGEFIGVPINYVSFRWVIQSKWDFLTGKATDPLHQWTAQALVATHTNAIQYVVLGPSRLFANYPQLPYGFALGLVAPLLMFWLHRRFPNAGFNFWNTTVLFSTLSRFYGNISTGYLSKFVGATVSHFYVVRYRADLWRRYHFLIAAAFDTGYSLSLSAIFAAAASGWSAPVWFGNDPRSVERCFSL